jgi:hypothetical protein
MRLNFLSLEMSEPSEVIERYSFGAFLAQTFVESLATCMPDRLEWVELTGLELDIKPKLKFEDGSLPEYILMIKEREVVYSIYGAQRLTMRTELWEVIEDRPVWNSSIDVTANGYSASYEAFTSAIVDGLISEMQSNGILKFSDSEGPGFERP